MILYQYRYNDDDYYFATCLTRKTNRSGFVTSAMY